MNLDKKELVTQFEIIKKQNLKLNMERGQPSDENFDLSNPMLSIVNESNVKTPSGIDIRNYPGGVLGIPESRELCAQILGLKAEEILVGNNSSLKMIADTLTFALLRGLLSSEKPWVQYSFPKMIVTIPGYDRHFTLLNELGFEMIQVHMTEKGPDIEKIEKIVKDDASVKGILFVPTYSNPTGDIISDDVVKRLASMETKATDFAIFADDSYVIHHLNDNVYQPLNLLRACEEAGNPNRVFIFGSTSKITFPGAGLGFIGCSKENIEWLKKRYNARFIGPNKIEQYRHVKFLSQYKGGIQGIMKDHAKILRPKFEMVQKVLKNDLDDEKLATWTNPQGGYFVSLNTTYPIATRVVKLAQDLGVSFTPAGATYPFGKNPDDNNIRIAPTRSSIGDIEKAIGILALCIKIASYEYDKKVKIVE